MTYEERVQMQRKLLYTAAELFLKKGYTAASLKKISDASGIDINHIVRIFGCKENIMCELVKYVLEEQFNITRKLIEGKTEDKILFYAAETTLQLYMAESSEVVRELYSVAYSLPNTMDIIQHTITGKLEEIFKEHLPNLETKDFFELEIASGGIMRGFLTKPCDMYFTIDRKVKRFLETTFAVYKVSEEKTNEAIEFVKQFDFKKIADETIASMLTYLENRKH